MNKASLFIFTIASALLLASCTTGGGAKKEMTAEEAEAILTRIQEQAATLNYPYRFDYKEMTEYKDENGADDGSEEEQYVLVYNKANEFYYSYTSKEDGVLLRDAKGIIKEDRGEEEVCYSEETYYNEPGAEDDEKDISAAAKKDNPIYDFQCEYEVLNGLTDFEYIEEAFSALISAENYTLENIQNMMEYYASRGYKVTASYKGNENGNMDIRVLTEPMDSSQTTGLKKGDETISFENYKFTKLVSVSEQFDGEKLTINASMKYTQTTFSLPNGWKDHVLDKGLTAFPSEALASFLTTNNVSEEVPSLAQQGAAYDYYVNEYSFGDTMCVRIHVEDGNAAFSAIHDAFPNSWTIEESSYRDNVVVGYHFTSPLQQIEITAENHNTWISVFYSPKTSN